MDAKYMGLNKIKINDSSLKNVYDRIIEQEINDPTMYSSSIECKDDEYTYCKINFDKGNGSPVTVMN